MMLMLLFQQAIEKKVFSEIDVHVAKALTAHLDDPIRLRLQVMIAWLSSETRQGHVCVVPEKLSPYTLFQGGELLLAEAIWQVIGEPSASDWHDILTQTDVVGSADRLSPFIYHQNKLYLQRLWLDEMTVANFFQEKVHQRVAIDVNKTQSILDDLFPVSNDAVIDWQKVAVAAALTSQVAIISGGPGTGKTTTVAKLLTALVKMSTASSLRIMLAAPTGKAAARLTESLGQALSKLPLSDEQSRKIPKETVTIHRLLGAKKQSRFFTHSAQNLLHVDILIVDEASMVGLSLMASLLNALPNQARLILLGDRDQLASVESGAVFGDLCQFADNGYSAKRAAQLSLLTGFSILGNSQSDSISDMIALLHKSYRFKNDSGIGQLATAINGQDHRLINVLFQGNYPDIAYLPFETENDYQTLLTRAVEGYREYLTHLLDSTPEEALARFSQFQLLCTLRHGEFGVAGLNQQIERRLAEAGDIQQISGSAWYVGRPVMIRRNNHTLGLFNGDVGVALPSQSSDKLLVYFTMPDSQIKGFSPNRLPQHETAFAMTVHQSQGSEFDRVLFILPDRFSPVLTRQLIYTAVTRAKKGLIIVAKKSLFLQGVDNNKQRESGLSV